MGRVWEITTPLEKTVRVLKEVLALKFNINIDKSSLIRCVAGEGRDRYIYMEDSRLLQEYDLKDNDRLVLLPSIRSGPLTEGPRAEVFLSPDDALIDRLLEQNGNARNKNCRYVLAQLDTQRPGEYTLFEVVPPFGGDRDSSTSSIELPKKIVRKTLTPAEMKRNDQTRSKVAKLREDLERRKRTKKGPPSPAPTPISRMDFPCVSCKQLTVKAECERCDQIYCHEHLYNHVCQRQDR